MAGSPTVYPTPTAGTEVGLRTVLSELGSNIPVQMDKDLFLLNPNENPFTLMTTQVPKDKVGDDTYKWHDDEIVPEHSTLLSSAAAAAADASATWIVQSGAGAYFAQWDIVKNMANGSWGMVTGVSSDTLTVEAHVAILAASAGDVIQRLGNAMGEVQSIPKYRSTAHTERTNYIQRHSHPIRYSRMAMKAADYFGGFGADYIRETKKALKENARNIEWAFLLNPGPAQYTPETTITNPADETGDKFGISMGLDYFISTYAPTDNVRDEDDLTEYEFYDWLEPCFEYGSSTKTLYTPPRLLQAMMRWNLKEIRFEPSKKKQTLGLNFADVTTPHGQIKLINHKMLKARASGHYHYAFLVDHGADKIKYVYFNGLDTQFLRDQVKDGKHQVVDEIATYCGTKFRLADCHGRLRFKDFS